MRGIGLLQAGLIAGLVFSAAPALAANSLFASLSTPTTDDGRSARLAHVPGKP